MSRHRAPCRSIPPTVPVVNGIYHRHICIHEATLAFGTTLEHECRCGMTWTDELIPIPAFAECGRPGCDLREKRVEHGHGDRPSPYLMRPAYRGDRWGVWPLVLIAASVVAIVWLAVEWLR